MKNLGNFYSGQTIRGSFNSRSTSGAPITLAGTPALAVYKDGNTTQVTTGVTLTVDFDAVTGYHVYEIVTTDAFYARGSDFRVVLTAGTVDSVSVVGVEVGAFSIENRSDELILRNAFVALELPVATYVSSSVVTLTGGPANDIPNVMAIIYDESSPLVRIVAEGSYVGSTGTLTLTEPLMSFTEAGDKITLVAVSATSTDVNVTQWGGTAVGSVTLPANVTQISGDSGAADNLELACDGTGYNIGGGLVVSASVTGAVGSVTGAVGSVTGNVGGNVTGSVGSVLGGINTTAGTITTLDALDTAQDTQHGSTRTVIGTNGAGLSAIPWNATWDSEVQSEVQDAIEANHLDHLLATDYDPASKPGVATALLNELVENDGGVARYTANALEQAPSGTGASAASIRAEMDANSTQLAAIVADTNELQADWANGGRLDLILDTAALGGSGGLDAAGMRAALGMATANLDTQLGDIPTVAEFNARSLPSADYFVVGDYISPPTAAAIADAVWDEATSGHATAGSYGASVLMIGVGYRWTRSGGTSTYDDTTVTRAS